MSEAIPDKTRVVKVWAEEGDLNPIGTEGVVLTSVEAGEHGFGYFVEWDSLPGIPVFVMAKKIAAKP